MCPVWGLDDDKAIDSVEGLMPLEKARKLLDELVAAKPLIHPCLYGEPLMAPGLKDHIRQAKGAGMPFAMNSNGILLTQDLAEFFVEQQVDSIMFSIDAVTSQGLAVGTRTSYYEPGDIVTYDVKKRAFTKLTDVNGDILAGKQLGEVEEIWYTSLDNYKIQGWIVKPPDFDPSKKYPLMLSIHGGPHSMYGVNFNFGFQEHAANGYVVLYTNPRGSTGYGSAFGNAIKNAYPSKDFDDLMNGVNEVIKRGYIDTLNMFVYGCSGGGVLTSWTVGHTKRFAAASANCAVTNWFSFVGTTDGASWYHNFAKLPWEDPTEHLRRSSIMYVGNVTTPTMLMTGEMDLRTPMEQTEEYYRALKMQKVPTAMVRFKNEWHGTGSTPSNFMRTQLYLRAWFEKYKRPSAGISS